MDLSDEGKIVDGVWEAMFRFSGDYCTWIVMPNHLHGIIAIGDDSTQSARRKPLGRRVGAFKTLTTKRINELRQKPGETIWQRNFYEHIIRDERSFGQIVAYIQDNPLRWGFDPENPVAHDTETRARRSPHNR